MVKDNENRKTSAQEMLARFRRREILDAANELVQSEGLQDLTMDRIAESAGVSKGTLYTYFKDKDDLIHSWLVESTESLMVQMEEFAKKDGPIRERLLDMTDLFESYGEKHRELLIYVHKNGEHQKFKGDEEREIFMNIVRMISSVFENGIQKGELIGIDPQLIAYLYLGSLHDLLVSECCHMHLSSVENARFLVDLYLDGIIIKGKREE